MPDATEPPDPFKHSLLLDDDKHIAAALYHLQCAIAAKHNLCDSEVHWHLRDAAYHAEQARLFWTKEYRVEIVRIGHEVFGEPAP